MIKYRGKRLDNGELVEGLLIYDNYIRVIRNHIFIHDRIEHHYKSSEDFEIHPSTLQVMTTDGWADIADVEVVRKNHVSEVGKMDAKMYTRFDLEKAYLAGCDSVDFEEWFMSKIN